MPIKDPTIGSSFAAMTATRTGTYGGTRGSSGGFTSQIDETNRRIDGVLRHQNPSPEVRAKIEELRRSFNDRMSGISGATTDRAKMMQEYRAARGELSDALTELLGGPRAG